VGLGGGRRCGGGATSTVGGGQGRRGGDRAKEADGGREAVEIIRGVHRGRSGPVTRSP
jgi:hypothetical protein